MAYIAYSNITAEHKRNPAELLSYALNQPDLNARVVETLPWMTCEYVDMNWDWLIGHAKQNDRQNQLGFVVTLAGELAARSGDSSRSEKLTRYRELLDRSRLVREDTLCHDSMTNAERKWLEKNRPPAARHWQLLTDLDVKHLTYAPA